MAKRVGSHLAVYNASGITLADGAETGLFVDENGRLLISATVTMGSELEITNDSGNPIPVTGSVAAGATDSGNPVKIGGVNSTTLPTLTDGQRGNAQLGTRGALLTSLMVPNSTTAVALAVSNVDGVTAGSVGSRFEVAALGYNFNGTSFDRTRSVTNGLNSTGTGINASGIVAQLDDTATGSVTENQFAPVRMSSNRALMVEERYTYGRATADTQIKGSAGFIHTVNIAALTATPTAGLLTIYDSLTESGTVIYAEWIFATDVGHTIILDVDAGTGIYVAFDATLANVQATVSYR